MGDNDTVTMFNMNRYISEHLLEKLDRSAYTHHEEEEEGATAAATVKDEDGGDNNDDNE
jgi:hypothetical protein